MTSKKVEVGYRRFAITSKTYKAVYPAISPTEPSLSQAGRTVLITGATRGIGFEIARAFGKAGAKRIIVVGREDIQVRSVAEKLTQEFAGTNPCTIFEGRSCQIADPASVDGLWDQLSAEGNHVDVLVLNAAMTGQFGKLKVLGWEKVWQAAEVNIRSSHQFCDRLEQQALGQGHKVRSRLTPVSAYSCRCFFDGVTVTKFVQKYIVNISTSAIHDFAAASYAPSYSLTKNSAALLLQLLARERPAPEMQIVSVHPGAILTPGAENLGADESTLDWDDSKSNLSNYK